MARNSHSNSPEASWRSAYLVMASYVALCLVLVMAAPDVYMAKLPASQALSSASDFPSTTGFCVDMMWMLFPLIVTGLALTAPVVVRANAKTSKLPVFLFSVAVVACVWIFLAYIGSLSGYVPKGTSSRANRLVMAAMHNRMALVLLLSWYFCTMAMTFWLAFIAAPRIALAVLRRSR